MRLSLMDLQEKSGLPISIDSGVVRFSGDVLVQSSSSRSLQDMLDFLREPDSSGPAKPYHMHRRVCLKKDSALFTASKLRYDITVISPGLIGNEFVKTIGHYHPANPAGVPFPEIYEVISGKALFLIQKPSSSQSSISQAFLIECAQGQKAVMPPGFGHITINATKDFLVLSNIVSEQFESLYDSYRQLHGACHYILDSNGKLVIEKNKSYLAVPQLVAVKPRQSKGLAIDFKKPLYDSFIHTPGSFSYLNSPQEFLGELAPQACFTF